MDSRGVIEVKGKGKVPQPPGSKSSESLSHPSRLSHPNRTSPHMARGSEHVTFGTGAAAKWLGGRCESESSDGRNETGRIRSIRAVRPVRILGSESSESLIPSHVSP